MVKRELWCSKWLYTEVQKCKYSKIWFPCSQHAMATGPQGAKKKHLSIALFHSKVRLEGFSLSGEHWNGSASKWEKSYLHFKTGKYDSEKWIRNKTRQTREKKMQLWQKKEKVETDFKRCFLWILGMSLWFDLLMMLLKEEKECVW